MTRPESRSLRAHSVARRLFGGRGRPPLRAVAALVTVVLALVVALLPSPYAIERPGPVFDTLGSSGSGSDRAPLIEIPGKRTYPTTGSLDLLTVSVVGSPTGGPSWLELALAWLNPSQGILPLQAVFPPGVSGAEVSEQGNEQMTGSQRSATAAALTQLGYDVRGDVRVQRVEAGSAAAGRLQEGDVVTSFDGSAIDDACALQNAVIDGGTDPATVVVRRGGERRVVRVTPRAVGGGGGGTRPLLGVSTDASFTFPFTVRLRIDDVGGPSAGMMFALGIIDKLTPGALTGGRHVAGTGTICGDGRVGAIGGIVQKMAAAKAAGATVFLAPEADCDEVVGHVPAGLDVIAVTRLSGALEALERLREEGSSAGLPRCSAKVGSTP